MKRHAIHLIKMNFMKIDHIDIAVANFDRAVEFYKKLGTLVRTTSHRGKSAEFLIGGTIFEIHQVGLEGTETEITGINHISFLVDGDREELLQVHSELMEKGIKSKFPDRPEPTTGRLHFSFRDEDGNRYQASSAERKIPEEV
jgi:catechol 2,3-dioxygenase-like lactoylglutathione lyase family enzyme